MKIGEILSKSWSDFKAKMGIAIGFTVLFYIFSNVLQRLHVIIYLSLGEEGFGLYFGLIVNALEILVANVLSIGLPYFFLKLVRGEEVELNNMFWGFFRFFKILWLGIYTSILIFLWYLLLIIPGIIAGLNYALVFYIFIDNEEISAPEAVKLSKKMMRGHRLQLLCLSFVFLGVAILCLLTLGIGFIWAAPWLFASMANFYLAVRADYESKLIAE